MPIFRKVLGPFKPMYETSNGRVDKMEWHFIVIRDDYTTCHYTLQCYPKTNKYTAVNGDQNEDSLGRRVRAMGSIIYGSKKPTVVHERMFIEYDNTPVSSGDTVSGVLKQHLRDEDIANINSARLTGKLAFPMKG